MSDQDLFTSPMNVLQPLTGEAVIPLLEEQLVISKRVVETGNVRLQKHTEERSETVEVPLTRVRWRVDHVPMNQVVLEHPAIRQEGETTIYPVVEERVTILRELVLLEEVRITRNVTITVEKSDHVLRRERISEERYLSRTDQG